MSKRTQRVRVRLRMPPGTKPTGPAHIRLSIDDVSLVDRAAIPCHEATVVASELDELMGPYELQASLEPGKTYTVRAHVDWSGDGSIAPGDLITKAQTAFPRGSLADQDMDMDVDVDVSVV